MQQWLKAGFLTDASALVRSQLQQVMVRVVLTLAGFIYVYVHGPLFQQLAVLCFTSIAIYLLYAVAAYFWIQRAPMSPMRMLISPILDVYLAVLGMWVDGGHTSLIYLPLLIIVVGNGFRFGNPMLLYTQALSFIAMMVVSAGSFITPAIVLEPIQLLVQLVVLFFIPIYAYLLGKRSEDAIRAKREVERESMRLLKGSPIPTFTYQADVTGNYRILYANPAMATVCRHQPSALVDIPVDKLVLMEDSEEMLLACQQAIESAQESPLYRFYVRGKNTKNEMLSLLCHATNFHRGDQKLGICFVLDITENEKLHAELERVHRQGYIAALTAGIAHDFRNILTSVIGHAEVLQMESDDEHLKEQLGLIIGAGERGSTLVNQLLGLAHTVRDKKEIMDVSDPLGDIISLSRVQLPMNIKLHCMVDKNLPEVLANPVQLEQIILNLINNASSAIDGSGNISIEITADARHRIAKEGMPTLRISVLDDGCGISESDLPHIFKPFWTTHKSEGGSGLGLAMVQRIVGWHHGELNVESTVGKGTRVTIHLPSGALASRGEAKLPEQLEEEVPQEPVSTKPWKILLVDDNEDVLRVHRDLLQRMGHSLMTADNGSKALDIFNKHKNELELLITDYRMPEMDGLELAKAVREQNDKLPILMITAYGEDEHLLEAPDYNVGLLGKPVSYNKLAATIHTLQSDQEMPTSLDDENAS